jgi:8-oxo-dGTP diphosphatase
MSDDQGETNKKKVRVVAGLMMNHKGQVLITQRQPKAFMPLKWEFPGGKVEPGEDDQQALKRELKEELGVDVKVGNHFMGLEHEYDEFVIDFHVYHCSLTQGSIQAVGVYNFRWVQPYELDSFEFPPADEPTIQRLLEGSSD